VRGPEPGGWTRPAPAAWPPGAGSVAPARAGAPVFVGSMEWKTPPRGVARGGLGNCIPAQGRGSCQPRRFFPLPGGDRAAWYEQRPSDRFQRVSPARPSGDPPGRALTASHEDRGELPQAGLGNPPSGVVPPGGTAWVECGFPPGGSGQPRGGPEHAPARGCDAPPSVTCRPQATTRRGLARPPTTPGPGSPKTKRGPSPVGHGPRSRGRPPFQGPPIGTISWPARRRRC
jgi:hypothetical protein